MGVGGGDSGDNNKKYKVAILDDFHGVELLDRFWRGAPATFSVSAFGYDSIAAWQKFTFLVDLGPLYAVWLLESYRAANAWSPAYLYVYSLQYSVSREEKVVPCRCDCY